MRGVLALVMLLVLTTGLATAQTSPSSDQGPAQQSGDTRDANRADNHRDWGWIGIFGLAGLLGLRRRRDVAVDRDVRPADFRRAG
jgi:MYXO-CTERM domain-containing protein